MQHAEEDDSLPGQDSFIDVVCNMVGILIVLVMIVGVKASAGDSESPSSASTSLVKSNDGQAVLKQLRAAEKETFDAYEQIENSVAKIKDMSMQSALVDARRQELVIMKAAVEKEIADRRSKLDEKGQRQFDVQREIAAAEIKLHQLTQEQITLLSQKPDVEQIECVPTPIVKRIANQEEIIHVRLKHRQLSLIPLAELMNEAGRRGGDHLRTNLHRPDGAEDVFGPINGYRMRMHVFKPDSPAPNQSTLLQPAQSAIIMRCAMVPVTDDIGQPVEQALLPDSPLMQALHSKRGAVQGVVVWAYPDSFSDIRTLKRALWDANLAVAVRPQQPDSPIMFGTDGADPDFE